MCVLGFFRDPLIKVKMFTMSVPLHRFGIFLVCRSEDRNHQCSVFLVACGWFFFLSLFIYYIGNSCKRNGSMHLPTPAEAVNVDNIDVPDYTLSFQGALTNTGFTEWTCILTCRSPTPSDPETQWLLADIYINVRQSEQFRTNRIQLRVRHQKVLSLSLKEINLGFIFIYNLYYLLHIFKIERMQTFLKPRKFDKLQGRTK